LHLTLKGICLNLCDCNVMTFAENISWDNIILDIIDEKELSALTHTVMLEYHRAMDKLPQQQSDIYFFSNIVGNISLKDGTKKSAYIECVWKMNDVNINAVKVEMFDDGAIPDAILDRINELQKTFDYIENKFIEWQKQ